MADNSAYEAIFWEACRIGDITELEALITEKKFDVNQPLYRSPRALPLICAIRRNSTLVANLLLDHDADPNVLDGWALYEATERCDIALMDILLKNIARPNPPKRELLFKAVKTRRVDVLQHLLDAGSNPKGDRGHALNAAIVQKDLEMVRLLLTEGADPNAFFGELLTLAVETNQLGMVRLLLNHGADLMLSYDKAIISAFSPTGNREIGDLLLSHAVQLEDKPEADEEMLRLAKYSKLSLAILQMDVSRVTELLGNGQDYVLYSNILEKLSPSDLAIQRSSYEVCKAFINAGAGIDNIFRVAVSKGNIDLVELCASIPGFDMLVQYGDRRHTFIEVACFRGYLEVIKILVQKCGLKLDSVNPLNGRTPLTFISNLEVLRGVLETFPEAGVNAIPNNDNDLLYKNRHDCEMFTLLLEYGADPILRHRNFMHRCEKKTDCRVVRYLQKVWLLDQNYVRSVVHRLLDMQIEEFLNIEIVQKSVYLDEIKKMKDLQISYSTKEISKKTLLDFALFRANNAARFSKNEEILRLYTTEYNEDFRNYLPNYGFRLNYQLRRGQARYQRLQAVFECFCESAGIDLPLIFAEYIFGYFSNSTLERFMESNNIN